MSKAAPTRLLTIAGSDSGGGAGIQADLKTFQALGCYGMSVITALTAQNTLTVKSILAVSADFVADQMSAVFDDIGVDAVKIGMLHSTPVIETVARRLRAYKGVPVVLDPVMVAKDGSPLLDPGAVRALRESLLPIATVLTPNLPEAEILLGRSITSQKEMAKAARDFLVQVPAIVIKGGHLKRETTSPDFFATRSDPEEWLEHPRITTKNTHGTGCTFAAAIAAFLGRKASLRDAVVDARNFLQSAIISGAQFKLGNGHGPVDHAVRWPQGAAPPAVMDA